MRLPFCSTKKAHFNARSLAPSHRLCDTANELLIWLLSAVIDQTLFTSPQKCSSMFAKYCSVLFVQIYRLRNFLSISLVRNLQVTDSFDSLNQTLEHLFGCSSLKSRLAVRAWSTSLFNDCFQLF